MKNYLMLKKKFFRTVYFYVDAPNNWADMLFEECGLKVRYACDINHYGDFKLVVVDIPKRSMEEFEKCLEKLHKKLTILYGMEYVDALKHYKIPEKKESESHEELSPERTA